MSKEARDQSGERRGTVLLMSAACCVVLSLIYPAGSYAAQLRTLPGASIQKVDPTSLKLMAALNFLPPVDNSKITTPAQVKAGAQVAMVCTWEAEFVKPAVLQKPISITVIIAETTGAIVQLKTATTSIKAGNYSFPGFAGKGEVSVTWKPGGLGVHDLSCIVSTTNAEWWGQGALPVVKAYRKVQVEPDKYKFCPFAYPVQIAKSPKGDQFIAGSVGPAEVMLNFNYSQTAGNQFVCHYRSKSGDISDVAVTVPCPGAVLLPPIPGNPLKQDRYFCNE